MEKGHTKRAILDAAMELFSVQGFEATSVSQIAEAVGIRKASLYNHFAGKQDILDALLNETLTEYDRHSIFANADWSDPDYADRTGSMTPDTAVRMIQDQVRYVLHDSKISKGRKLLTVEQFQNAEMAAIRTKQNYDDILAYFTGFVRALVRKGILAEHDTEIAAAQLCLPINVWLELCDREPEREDEVMALIERHIRQFFAVYRV